MLCKHPVTFLYSLATKFLAHTRPEGLEAVEDFYPQALAILENKLGRPKGGWTNQSLMIAIARLGGYRRHDLTAGSRNGEVGTDPAEEMDVVLGAELEGRHQRRQLLAGGDP